MSKGRRDSDMRPKMRSEQDLPPRKKGFYMDDALTKTSKWDRNLMKCASKKLSECKI